MEVVFILVAADDAARDVDLGPTRKQIGIEVRIGRSVSVIHWLVVLVQRNHVAIGQVDRFVVRVAEHTAHRSKVAAAVNVAVDMATADVDRSVPVDTTGGPAVARRRLVVRLVDASARAIHVAVVLVLARSLRVANNAALDVDNRRLAHMAILATAKHRAMHFRILADFDTGPLDESQVAIEAACTAFASTIHVAAIHRVAMRIPCRSDLSIALYRDMGDACIVVALDTHRGHAATTIDASADTASRDGHSGVAIHLASGRAIVQIPVAILPLVQATTAAIHVAMIAVGAH